MAQPFDDATTFLTTSSALVRQVYLDRFEDMYGDFTRINKLFKPTKRPVESDGWNIQVRDSNMHGARTNTDINADFPTPRTSGFSTYKVTLSENPSANDLRRVALSLQTTWMDIERSYTKQVSPIDFSTDLVSQANRNLEASMALHRYLDATALLGTINGTPKKNDSTTMLYADASAISTTGGARVLIDGGSIANFSRGMVLNSYTSTTLDTYELYVTDVNPVDNSIGLYGIDPTSGEPSTSININYLADNDNFYLSGEKDKGLKSMGNFFSTPASGESYFGKDRTLPNNYWLRPTKTGPTTARQFVKTDLDTMSIAMGYVIADDPAAAYLALMTPELDQRFRNEVGNDIIVNFPTNDQKGKILANYGFDGAMYRHPRLGRIGFEVDALAPPNKIRFMHVGDWEMFTAPGASKFTWLPGEMGNWYRMSSSVPGGGKTTTFRMDGYTTACDACFLPRRQGEVGNITA